MDHHTGQSMVLIEVAVMELEQINQPKMQRERKAAKKLRIAAQDNKLDELNSLFSELSSTCKSCHRSYKN